MTVMQEFTKGLWKELPPFRLVLGLCPTLAVTNSADNGLGMGLAVIFVLVLSNMLISMVRSIIPKKVRIACFIVIAASLVVAVESCLCRPMPIRSTSAWVSSCPLSWSTASFWQG